MNTTDFANMEVVMDFLKNDTGRLTVAYSKDGFLSRDGRVCHWEFRYISYTSGKREVTTVHDVEFTPAIQALAQKLWPKEPEPLRPVNIECGMPGCVVKHGTI